MNASSDWRSARIPTTRSVRSGPVPVVSGSARGSCSPVAAILAASRFVARRTRRVLPTRRWWWSAVRSSTQTSSARSGSGARPARTFGRRAEPSTLPAPTFISVSVTATGRPSSVRAQYVRSTDRLGRPMTCGSRSIRSKSASTPQMPPLPTHTSIACVAARQRATVLSVRRAPAAVAITSPPATPARTARTSQARQRERNSALQPEPECGHVSAPPPS